MSGPWLFSFVGLWLGFCVILVGTLTALVNLGVVRKSFDTLVQQVKPATSRLKVGQVLPKVTWRTMTGETRSVAAFKGRRQAFAIVSPTCAPCQTYLRKVAEDGGDDRGLDLPVRPIVVSLGDVEATAALLRQVGLPKDLIVLIDQDRQVMDIWGINGTPSTIVVDDDLRVVDQFAGAGGCPAQQPVAAKATPA